MKQFITLSVTLGPFLALLSPELPEHWDTANKQTKATARRYFLQGIFTYCYLIILRSHKLRRKLKKPVSVSANYHSTNHTTQ